jgi:hypothetical protein
VHNEVKRETVDCQKADRAFMHTSVDTTTGSILVVSAGDANAGKMALMSILHMASFSISSTVTVNCARRAALQQETAMTTATASFRRKIVPSRT